MNPTGMIAIALGAVGWIFVAISLHTNTMKPATVARSTAPLTRQLATENLALRDPAAAAIAARNMNLVPLYQPPAFAPASIPPSSFVSISKELDDKLMVLRVEQAAREGAYEGATQAAADEELMRMLRD